MKRTILLAASLAALAGFAREKSANPSLSALKLKVVNDIEMKADYLSANRQTGEAVATGNVVAVSEPYRVHTDHVTRSSEGLYDFGHAFATTCTNELDHLHWSIHGEIKYQDKKAVTLRNMTLKWYGIPVAWLPFWYYPLDTNYGVRVLPGYTSKWGAYLLTGYVYNLVGDSNPEGFGLGGSTYVDFRSRNGVAVGQTVRWRLGDFGKGRFKVYHAWDEHYDKYKDSWDTGRHMYSHWGSKVERERYRLLIDHSADFTERDMLRVHAQYLSDSHFLHDFFRRDETYEVVPANEMWYEHRENAWSTGASVSGPVNRFYGGTQRLPEAWVAINPTPLFMVPWFEEERSLNYESQTRAGYMNRNPAVYSTDDRAFKYTPYIGENGRGADYQAFRVDTNHRFTLPMKFADAVSFVPRAGYRVTYWSDSGSEESAYCSHSGDAMTRQIAEVGFTIDARATGWLNDEWRHTFEPYLDYSLQKAWLSGSSGRRYYAFDAYDRSADWLDQFGFEGRGLPYSWHGIRPGIRNTFQRRDEDGILRTVLDTDFYLAVPFQDESYYGSDEPGLKGFAKDQKYGQYARSGCVVPGFMMRYRPSKDLTFGTRIEYDTDADKFAYADIAMKHRVSKDFNWYLSYIGRDSRVWDYLSSPNEELENGNADRWNYVLSNVIGLGFDNTICDSLAWGPFLRWDVRRNDAEQVGLKFDILTDCIGYRIEYVHEDSYRRIDGSHESKEDRIMFYIYLRALGPASMLDLVRF